jgi:hypothetical protein
MPQVIPSQEIDEVIGQAFATTALAHPANTRRRETANALHGQIGAWARAERHPDYNEVAIRVARILMNLGRLSGEDLLHAESTLVRWLLNWGVIRPPWRPVLGAVEVELTPALLQSMVGSERAIRIRFQSEDGSEVVASLTVSDTTTDNGPWFVATNPGGIAIVSYRPDPTGAWTIRFIR